MAQPETLAQLHIRFPDGHTDEQPLYDKSVLIGRLPPAEIVLPDSEVSRKHAVLKFEVDRITLTDLDSTNGTFLEDRRLEKNRAVLLGYGQAFRIGPYHLEIIPVTRPAAEHPISNEEFQAGPSPLAVPEPLQLDVIDLIPLPESISPLAEPKCPASLDDGPIYGLVGEGSRYVNYLPPLYRESSLVKRLLLALEVVSAPIEQAVDNFDFFLDPFTTPEFFLETLAAWLGLSLDENWSLEQRRTLVAEGFSLYSRRGTRKGLSRHLEIYTGHTPEISEPADRPHFFEVLLPYAASLMNQQVIHRIIQSNQPANTRYNLKFAPAR